MDLNDTPEQAAYRAEGAGLARGQQGRRRPRASGSSEDTAYIDSRRAWQRKLAEAGLAGVTWPAEYGGQGLGPIEQVTVNQEISRADVPGILDVIGIGMLGPCLIAHGTEEQKTRYLGPMLHGDEVWCQMFSEPAAGSDLAGGPDARAPGRRRQLDAQRPEGVDHERAVRLVRAAAGAHRSRRAQAQGPDDVHRPDGRAEGVTVRGLRQISGEAEFNEVFFDDVVLDDDAVVGGVGNGWGTALTVLMFERLTIGFGSEGFGSPAGSPRRSPPTRARAQRLRRSRQRLGEVITELLAVRFNGYRALTVLSRGQIPGPEAGPGEGDDGQRRDRRHRPRRRRARPRRARRRQRVELPDLVPARPEVGRAAPSRSCATRSASACSACRRSRGWTRACRSASCARRRRRRWPDELRSLRRAGCCCARPPAARSRATRRSRPRARRWRTPTRCPTCGRWPSRPAGPGC